jgi:hypothetical protein
MNEKAVTSPAIFQGRLKLRPRRVFAARLIFKEFVEGNAI